MNQDEMNIVREHLRTIERFGRSALLAFVALLTALLVMAFFASRVEAADIVPFVQYTHGSDIFRGQLLVPYRGSDEWTYESITAGVTVRFPQARFTLDVSHGAKALNCPGVASCEWESGSQLSLRYYFGRKARSVLQ